MYDRLGPDDEDYSEYRPTNSRRAIVGDAFNRTFEIFVERHKMCLLDAVEEAVEETLRKRNGGEIEDPPHPREKVAEELKSELRSSPLVQDSLPKRYVK